MYFLFFISATSLCQIPIFPVIVMCLRFSSNQSPEFVASGFDSRHPVAVTTDVVNLMIHSHGMESYISHSGQHSELNE